MNVATWGDIVASLILARNELGATVMTDPAVIEVDGETVPFDIAIVELSEAEKELVGSDSQVRAMFISEMGEAPNKDEDFNDF